MSSCMAGTIERTRVDGAGEIAVRRGEWRSDHGARRAWPWQAQRNRLAEIQVVRAHLGRCPLRLRPVAAALMTGNLLQCPVFVSSRARRSRAARSRERCGGACRWQWWVSLKHSPAPCLCAASSSNQRKRKGIPPKTRAAIPRFGVVGHGTRFETMAILVVKE